MRSRRQHKSQSVLLRTYRGTHAAHVCVSAKAPRALGENFSGLIFHIPVSCRGRVTLRHLSEPVRAHLARACHFLKHHFATPMGRIHPLKRLPVFSLTTFSLGLANTHFCYNRSRRTQLQVRVKSNKEHLRWTFITVVSTDKCPLG